MTQLPDIKNLGTTIAEIPLYSLFCLKIL